MPRAKLAGLCVATLIAAAFALTSSCGAMLAVGVDSYGNYDPFYDDYAYLHNGVWHGKYVWYDGDWHYLGYGTPYIYDPFDMYSW